MRRKVWSGALAIVMTLTGLGPSFQGRSFEVARAAASCPSTARCGFGCTAYRTGGFCVRVLDYSTSGRLGTPLGSVTIGPSVVVTCEICECWYIYQNDMGNLLFMRTSELQCSGGTDGVDTFGPHVE